MKSLFPKLVLAIILSCFIAPPVWAQRDVKEAVVKIYTVFNKYDYREPWQMLGQESGSGSGCIISGRRILTNAHVVGDQTFIQVRRKGEVKKYTAEVEVVAHECDLAILRVDDDSFFSGIQAFEIGGLPELGDEVTAYGFPEGGDKLCITKGVVSRVEHSKYAQSNANLLTCQIDAAINPGSSGGPVVKDDKIVGVAFEAASGENIGYMVPTPVINHFLEDIKDGKYDGIPEVGIFIQRMENPAIRAKFGMTTKQSGVLINRINPGSPAGGILKPGDIILSIDGKNVENDGTIEFRKGERTFFGYLIQKKYINDTVKIEILRDSRIVDIEIKFTNPVNFGRLVPYKRYDVAPTYYILGGMVFEPLTLNYLETFRFWERNRIITNLKYYFLYGKPTEDRREVIVLIRVLADKINVGYHDQEDTVISYVNGKKISTMKDLVNAFEEHNAKYHIIVGEQDYMIVLDKKKVDESAQRILKKYKIDADRSKDLER